MYENIATLTLERTLKNAAPTPTLFHASFDFVSPTFQGYAERGSAYLQLKLPQNNPFLGPYSQLEDPERPNIFDACQLLIQYSAAIYKLKYKEAESVQIGHLTYIPETVADLHKSAQSILINSLKPLRANLDAYVKQYPVGPDVESYTATFTFQPQDDLVEGKPPVQHHPITVSWEYKPRNLMFPTDGHTCAPLETPPVRITELTI